MGIHIKRSTVKVRYLPHLLHLMVMLYVLVIDAEDTLMSCLLCANACACAMQSDRIGELTSEVWRGGRDEDIPSIIPKENILYSLSPIICKIFADNV